MTLIMSYFLCCSEKNRSYLIAIYGDDTNTHQGNEVSTGKGQQWLPLTRYQNALENISPLKFVCETFQVLSDIPDICNATPFPDCARGPEGRAR